MRTYCFVSRCLTRASIALSMFLIACEPGDAVVTHPTDFLGRWVRLKTDGSWGDTLTLMGDGRVQGSVGHSVPEAARWTVVTSRHGASFCASDANDRSCQAFRFVADTLLVGNPSAPTFFRRVR